MAHPTSLLFIVLFLLNISALVITNAQTPPPPPPTTPIVSVSVVGSLNCPITSFLPVLGLPVVGVNVTISCNGGQNILGQGVTNLLGVFNIPLINNSLPLNQLLGCTASANLGVASICNLLASNGTIVSPLSLFNTTQSSLGSVISLLANRFRLI